MDSGPVVVDLSSEDEADDDIVSKNVCVYYDLINQWLDGNEGDDANSVVDLDQHLSSVKNSGSVKMKSGADRNDSDDDCMILDGDPDKPVKVDDDKKNGGDGSDDLCILGQKGQIACRDFAHPRHLCANFSFNTTFHKLYCKLCHCFVCDSPAPCIYWGNGASFDDHCHATDKEERWKVERKSFKKMNTPNFPPQKLPTIKQPVAQPIRDPQPICNRIPVQAPIPSQPFKAICLRPCSNTNRPHQSPVCYRRQPPPEHYQRKQPIPRVNHSSLALAAASRTQHKRVGSIGSGVRVGAIGSSVTRPVVTPLPHAASSPSQMRKIMPQATQHPHVSLLGSQQRPRLQPVTSVGPQQRPVTLPRSQSMPMQRSVHVPVTTQIPSETNTALPEEDSAKHWRDIIAGMAAELGVSDSSSKSTIESQPYAPSSQSKAFDAPIQRPKNANQVMDTAPATISLNTTDFRHDWLEVDSNLATLQPSDPSVSVNNDAVSGHLHREMAEIDEASFLYDLDGTWSSIANV